MQLLRQGKDTDQVSRGLFKNTPRLPPTERGEYEKDWVHYIRCPIEGSNPRPVKNEARAERTDKMRKTITHKT